MRKNPFVFIFLVAFLLLILPACTDDKDVKKGSLVPARFELPFNNASAKQGESIRVQIEIPNPENIEQVTIYTSDTVIYEGNAQGALKVFEFSTQTWKIGTNQISLKTIGKDQKVTTAHRIVKVFPTIFPTEYSAEVIQVYPHNTSFYTQGLEFDGHTLYEGTGGKGDGRISQSRIAKINYKTGEILQEKLIDKKYFGEGITLLNDRLYQLTWQEHTCFVYDKNTFEELKQITYTGEGWGLCNDGEYLIMSDGTERIYYRDPNDFSIKKVLEVYTTRGPVKGLNELEYINGKIYANVYTQDYIVVIDPETGIITSKIDLSLVALDYRKTGEVLNGIAYNKETKQLFVTGKDWPNLLEIALIEE